MSRAGYILFAVVSFFVCGVTFGYAAAFFIQEFGGAMNPSVQFRGSYTLAFIGSLAVLGAVMLPIGALLLMPRSQE